MELATARTILGVSAGDDWTVVRAAYRARIRRAHPDVAGDQGSDASIQLNAAYRALATARREGRLHDEAPPTPPVDPYEADRGPRSPGAPPVAVRPVDGPDAAPPHDPPGDVRLLDRDTLALSSLPDETFRRLVEAAHEIGDLSYVDRSSGIFEAVLRLADGRPASLVVSLQWRAHDASCEAFCTLEALDRAEHLDVAGVVQQLVGFIPPDPEVGPLH